jgi:cell division protein FtsN
MRLLQERRRKAEERKYGGYSDSTKSQSNLQLVSLTSNPIAIGLICAAVGAAFAMLFSKKAVIPKSELQRLREVMEEDVNSGRRKADRVKTHRS